MFSALRQGSTIYILDKTKEPTIKIGYVETVSLPHPLYKTYNPAVSFGTNMQTVVDLTVKVEDSKILFECVPANLSIHSNGDLTISESREAMISEVDALLQSSKNVLQNVDKHKTIIASCENILKELNPVYAKEQERDTAIDSLTEQVNNMQNTLSRLENILIKRNDGDQ